MRSRQLFLFHQQRLQFRYPNYRSNGGAKGDKERVLSPLPNQNVEKAGVRNSRERKIKKSAETNNTRKTCRVPSKRIVYRIRLSGRLCEENLSARREEKRGHCEENEK